jgi:hypothetical protein
VGSLSEEVSAAVEGGWIKTHELGERIRSKGHQRSAISRTLGSAVTKWGTLAKVELLDEDGQGSTEGYVPSYEGFGKLIQGIGHSEAPSKFMFGPSLARLHGLAVPPPPEWFPLFVDVTALESARNCKAKVSVFPPGVGAAPHGQEVQAFWQPGDRPSVDLNAGESAMAELMMVNCSTGWRYNWNQGERDMLPNYFVRTPEARVGTGEDWYEMRSLVNLLVLSVYSESSFARFPFLFLRRKLTKVEMIPIVGYTSKRVKWSGKGLYTRE